jgi:hypothetical protein
LGVMLAGRFLMTDQALTSRAHWTSYRLFEAPYFAERERYKRKRASQVSGLPRETEHPLSFQKSP